MDATEHARKLHKAATDLRAKRISPDEFRAIMRASIAEHGAEAHERAKFAAICSMNR